jgi:hypothetical protein
MVGDVLMTGGLPVATLHGVSFYDAAKHLLYLNEWSGTYLRVDGDGAVTRHTNGDDGLLFMVEGTPHETDLAAINTDRALGWNDSDVLIEHVLGVGVFSEAVGLSRTHALTVLLAWLLAVMFKDHVQSVPVPLLTGPSGSRKTYVGRSIGAVITPRGLGFQPDACPANSKDTENIIINSHGLVLLDEFQGGKELFNLLKAITTGASIKRRILFTTSKEQTFHIDAVPFLTLNDDIWSDDAMQKRLLRMTMGQAEDAGGWRAEHYIWADWRKNSIRERAWNELVGRVAASMRFLRQAEEAGRADIRVQHRMSGFWGFILAVAEQEGVRPLMEETMQAVDDSQKTATALGDELLEVLTKLLAAQPTMCGRWIPAPELRSTLGFASGVSLSLSRGIDSTYKLNRRLQGNGLYATRLGFRHRVQGTTHQYFFEGVK